MAKESFLTFPERMALESEVKRKALDQFAAQMRVSCPGIVKSFDKVAQTVTVQLCVKENMVVAGLLEQGVLLPLLYDVPIYMPRAGKFVLTMPVTVDDECLVVFGDMCIDGWWQSGGVQSQIHKRRHDLSDGFAIIGPWSQPRVIDNYDDSAVRLRTLDNQTYIEVSEAEIIVEALTKVTVKAPTIEAIATELISATAPEITIEGTTSVIITSSGEVGIQAPSITLMGPTVIAGGLYAAEGAIELISPMGNSSIDGKPFLSHTHNAPDGGGATGGIL